MTLIEKANAISPRVCRILARKSNGRRPMSITDIAQASGMSRARVAQIAQLDRWDGIPIDTVVRFASACGINHLRSERQLDYARRRKMVHLQNGTRTQRAYFARLMAVN